DLLGTTSSSNQLVFLKGRGTDGAGGVIFDAPVVVGALGPAPGDLLVADLNGDCARDVATVNTNGTVNPPSGLSILIGRCQPGGCANFATSFGGSDRPDDEGGWLRLAWHRSALDEPLSRSLRSYQIWRRTVDAGVARMQGTPNAAASDWVMVADLPAVGAFLYSTTVPTTRDSIQGDSAPHAFFVRVVASSPGLSYDSDTLVLHSVDNLAPPAPAYLLRQPTGTGAIWVHWAPTVASDVLEYRVYRGASPIFVP